MPPKKRRVDLYFIENPAFGMIKIGVSDNVRSRLRNLSCACGVELVLLGTLTSGGKYETILHYAFNSTRRVGEWFETNAELRMLANNPKSVPAWIAANTARIEKGRVRHAIDKSRTRTEKVEAKEAEKRAKQARKLTQTLYEQESMVSSLRRKKECMEPHGTYTSGDDLDLSIAIINRNATKQQLQELAA